MRVNQQNRQCMEAPPPLPPLKEYLKVLPDRELRGLLTALDRLFPRLPPNLKDSDREIWFKAGQRFVVEFLLGAHTSIGANPIHVFRPELQGTQAGANPPTPTSCGVQHTVGPRSKVYNFFSRLLRFPTN